MVLGRTFICGVRLQCIALSLPHLFSTTLAPSHHHLLSFHGHFSALPPSYCRSLFLVHLFILSELQEEDLLVCVVSVFELSQPSDCWCAHTLLFPCLAVSATFAPCRFHHGPRLAQLQHLSKAAFLQRYLSFAHPCQLQRSPLRMAQTSSAKLPRHCSYCGSGQIQSMVPAI